ncbi:TIGR03086 family metal-binding protein [Antrihabitans cavernicola]|uniref:TIGR03086 family protein n=1 Tax=Antrihabitans cavernicola TaxID=2495913 RepID=A0A5A7SGY4_9NOCA|nr:TIGR03086 family metal-binding protein [Spelaeibacter cavernicola]KAA0024884.1 TIGR03086 family protein [Spelaeibacter cavernicola]
MREIESLNLLPVATKVSALAHNVGSDQFADPTPCDEMPVKTLLEHLMVAMRYSASAATGVPPEDDPKIEISPDDDSWKAEFTRRATALATAWADPEAWLGNASAGGVETTAQEAGRAAAMELVLHGWDLATATKQPFSPDDAAVGAVVEIMEAWADAEGREVAFGPVVDVPDDAPPLARALALSGRNPEWSA